MIRLRSMKINRYCIIEPNDTIERDALRKSLTIANPLHKSQSKFAGKTDVPETIFLYSEDELGSILIPRHFLADNKNAYWSIITENMEQLYSTDDLPDKPIKISWTKKKTCQLRRDQQAAVEALATSCDLLHADCGSGKTVVCVGLINKLKVRTAVLVNQEFLANQWKDSLLKFTNLTEDDIKINAGGKLDHSGKVNICLVQTLIRRDYEDNQEFYDAHSLVIADEVHTSVGSFKFREAIEKFPCARKGVTATIQRTDKLRVFMWVIGNRIHRMETNMLIPDIRFLDTRMAVPDNKYAMWRRENGQWINKGDNMPKLINILVSDKERNKRIAELIMKKYAGGRNVIILTHRRDHTKVLYELCDKIPDKEKLIMVGGKGFKDHPGCEEKNEPHITFATFQYVRQALDIPRLDLIVFTTPFAAKNDVQQAIGRVLRQYPGKPKPEAYYIYDSETTGAMRRARAVQKHCNALGYTVVKEAVYPLQGTGRGMINNKSGLIAKSLQDAGL